MISGETLRNRRRGVQQNNQQPRPWIVILSATDDRPPSGLVALVGRAARSALNTPVEQTARDRRRRCRWRAAAARGRAPMTLVFRWSEKLPVEVIYTDCHMHLLSPNRLAARCTRFPRLPDRPCPRGVRKALYLAPAAPQRTPEARAVRDDLAYAAVEAYYPVDAGEAELAVPNFRGQRPCAGLPAARRPAGEVGGRHPPLPCPGKFDAHRTERTARPGTPAGLAREGTERDAPSRDGAGWLLVQVRISARGDAATAPGRGGQTGWRPGAARRISKRSSTRGERRGSAPSERRPPMHQCRRS